MTILAIDPGPVESAFVMWDTNGDGLVREAGYLPNDRLRARFINLEFESYVDKVAIEMVACYGMAVGKEVFDTCLWVGRFVELAGSHNVQLVYRHEVKMHLCNSMRAKDANIRQALIDKHGPPGTKKNPSRTYGISGHLWSALAIADFVSSNGK